MGFHLIEVPIGSASCTVNRHICEEECIYILEGAGTVGIGTSVLQVEAGDFIAYAAGREVHDLRNTGFNILKYTIVGQRLDLILSTIMNRHGGSVAQMAKKVIFLIWQ